MRRALRWERPASLFCTDIVFDWLLRLIVTPQGQGRVWVGRYF